MTPELLAMIANVKPASDEEIVAICGAYMTQMEAMLISRIVELEIALELANESARI